MISPASLPLHTENGLNLTTHFAPISLYPIRTGLDVAGFFRSWSDILVTSATWLAVSESAINNPLPCACAAGDWALNKENEAKLKNMLCHKQTNLKLNSYGEHSLTWLRCVIKASKYAMKSVDVELPTENWGKCTELAETNRHCHKARHENAFTSPQRLAFHSGQAFSSQRSVVGGFVPASQLTSLSLHSNERVLIPEPQLTEHCKTKEKINSATQKRPGKTIHRHTKTRKIVNRFSQIEIANSL